jgi:DNA polymerase-3 subunit alpha
MSEFVHLHVHSEYSLREGALRLETLIDKCKQLGMTAVALTDTNGLYGAIRFYQLAKQAGIRPIIGVQLQIGEDQHLDTLKEARPGGPAVDTAVFLAEDFRGYQNLVHLVSLANSRPRRPIVTFSELTPYAESVLALVGGGESVILRAFSSGRSDEAQGWLNTWLNTWPQTQLFIDVQDHTLAEERKALPALIKWARTQQIPLVATNDVHYADSKDADIQRVLAQIEGGAVKQLQGDLYHLASVDEMEARFSKLAEAVAQTVQIAERCQLELPLDRLLLPKYPTLSGDSVDNVLRRAAMVGIRQRYGNDLTSSVRERLDHELSVIEKMGFADYFLLVADFIRFAHKNGISTGPGRGSAAGSIVAYALRITDVDPIAHKLLFERFLNPERVTWPDIDTDFEYERRNEVIQYVVDRYGASHVAQIGTFGTLAARAAIRDAGRVLKVDPKIVDRLAKLIPTYPGVTLDKAYAQVTGIGELLRANHYAHQLWNTARGLEGFPRHTSIHAAGVVISPIPLSDIVPVQAGVDGIPVTQYAMEDIERLGLIKMDFLGLRTLTLIDSCMDSLTDGQRFAWHSVPTNDRKTFEMLSKGETNGCFQLESTGVRRVLRDLRPTSMEDIIAVISLYRPGPMENIPTFISAKHGRTPIHYPHSDLEPVLKDTYGVIVYQEQIMQIASIMAGFSLGQADLLRRAVSKKKRDVLAAERSRFVAGCRRKGYDEEVADGVYDLIVRFADYGYNRSHAAAYAVLSYRTAYLRANYFPAFMAALLTMVMGDGTKIKDYVKDAKQHGVTVLPANVQRSEAGYTVESNQAIRAGILGVRNVGRGAVAEILRVRGQGPFLSLVDFLRRVNSRVCNRKAVESLLAAGALDDFLPPDVAEPAALKMLESAYQEADEGKQSQGLGLRFAEEDKFQSSNVLYIRYDSRGMDASTLPQIKEILSAHQGDTSVALYDLAKRKVRVLEGRWSVTLSPELISVLEEVVGLGNAKMGVMPKPKS